MSEPFLSIVVGAREARQQRGKDASQIASNNGEERGGRPGPKAVQYGFDKKKNK